MNLLFSGLLISVVVLNVFCAYAFTEDKEETVAKMYISELKNIRLRLEECEQRLVKRIQSPASSRTDKDARQDNALRIAEQEVSPKSKVGAACRVNAFRMNWVAREYVS